MNYKLTITYPLPIAGFHSFASRAEAEAFMRVLYCFNSGIESTLQPIIPALYDWTPDDADKMIIRHCLGRGDKVTPIKFARTKAKAGLKEAKDWVEAYFNDSYVHVARY